MTLAWAFPLLLTRVPWLRASRFCRRYSRTTILRRTFDTLFDKAELSVGQIISVWITGPILKSNPVQVSAMTIVVEP